MRGVFDDHAVFQDDFAIGTAGDLGIVRNQHQCGSSVVMPLEQQIENQASIGGIKVARRFIRHHDRRIHHECPCQRNALLLTAGKLNGIVIHALPQANGFQKFSRFRQAVPFNVQFERQQDIFQGGQGRDQLVRLEDEADLASAHGGQLCLGQVVDRRAIKPDFAFAGCVQPGQQPQQRALTAAAGAHNGNKLACRDAERDPLQDLDAPRPVLNPPSYVSNFNHPAFSSVESFYSYATPLRPVPAFTNLYTVDVDVWRRLRDSRRILPLPLFSFLLILIAAPLFGAERPVIVCYGDSITAGYGLQPGQAYSDALQHDLDQRGYKYKVENRGTSGATTKDAAANVGSIVQMHPSVVIVEFGGNDGLRGLPLEETRKNLDSVLRALEAAHIKVLLAGITLPPNYGPDYIQQFDKVFRDLASKHRVTFVPMIYKDLINVPGTIQQDGIHPTAKGSEIIARTLMPKLTPLLRK